MKPMHSMLRGRRGASVFALMSAAALLMTIAACGRAGSGGDTPTATDFPQRNVEVVVPYPAGGPTDLAARALADSMNEQDRLTDIRVQVSNVVGGTTITAAEQVASARPDGHTIGLFPTSTFTIVPKTRDVPYTLDDFEFILKTADSGLVLYVAANSPYQSFDDFATAAKTNPGSLTIGNPGSANQSETTIGVLLNAAGIDARVVNFEGTAPATNALLGGNIDAILVGPLDNAAVRGILFIGDAPEGTPFADIPTTEDVGIQAAFVSSPWIVVVPASVPGDIQTVLFDLLMVAAQSPRYKQLLISMGMTVPLTGSEENRAALEAETAWYDKQVSTICDSGFAAPICELWAQRDD